ncbi:Uncharacterized protein Fot_37661 [Forsythia ovata]|uniref:Uncharacterized protein n=1 Tax=Forsythia ovata TaxID=205694 RepID=A0ABD1S130_9LAMI
MEMAEYFFEKVPKEATSEERQQPYTSGIYDDIHVQHVEDSEDDVQYNPLIRTPRANKKHQVVASNIINIQNEWKIAKIANLDAEPDMDSMQLDSSRGKHIPASFDQNVNSLGEAFDNQNNVSKIDDHTFTNVQSSSKISKASGHVPGMLMKMNDTVRNKRLQVEAKTCNDEPDKQTRSETSLYLLDDDIIFSEEDLRHMDESAEKNRVQFQKIGE